MQGIESNKTYKDPNRKHGSQSEVPSIKVVNNDIIVDGYHSFTVNSATKNITFSKKIDKFLKIRELLATMRSQGNYTFCDVGCSAGLSSLIAHNVGFKNITSLDHGMEYIHTLECITKYCGISNINAKGFSFGDKMN